MRAFKHAYAPKLTKFVLVCIRWKLQSEKTSTCMLTRICPIIDRCVSRYTTGSREYLINDNDDDADDDGDNDDSEEDDGDGDDEY